MIHSSRSSCHKFTCKLRSINVILVSQFGGRPSQIDRNIDSYGRRQSRRVFPKVRFSRFNILLVTFNRDLNEIFRIYQVETDSIVNVIAILQ